MGLNAVLPPRTSWGFQFQSNPATSKDLSSSSAISSVSQNSFSTNSTAAHLSNLFVSKPAKRKHSMDNSDDDSSHGGDSYDSDNDAHDVSASFVPSSRHRSHRSVSPFHSPMRHHNATTTPSLKKPTVNKHTHHISKTQNTTTRLSSPRNSESSPFSKHSKRARLERVTSRSLPVSRLVETLDKKALETLVTSLVQARPDLTQQIFSIAPTVTVNTALEALREKLERIYHGLPYKGDQGGDYAFLRVKPAIEDFLASLSDYTSHFLPPNEPQPSNSLAFLDAATMILHRLPNWNNPENNHFKQIAYDRIAEAWVIALQEASKRANGLGLAYGGWQQKLDQHNEMSHGLITPAVNCLKYELKWINQDQKSSSSLFWGSNMSASNNNLNSSNNNNNDQNNSSFNNNNHNGNGHPFGQSSFQVSVNSWK